MFETVECLLICRECGYLCLKGLSSCAEWVLPRPEAEDIRSVHRLPGLVPSVALWRFRRWLLVRQSQRLRIFAWHVQNSKFTGYAGGWLISYVEGEPIKSLSCPLSDICDQIREHLIYSRNSLRQTTRDPQISSCYQMFFLSGFTWYVYYIICTYVCTLLGLLYYTSTANQIMLKNWFVLGRNLSYECLS